MRALCFVLLLFLLLGGAAAAAQDSTGTLHFYYPPRPFWHAHPPVYVDGLKAAELAQGTHFDLPLPAGPHLISSKDRARALQLDVKPGEQYYFRLEGQDQRLVKSFVLVRVREEDAAFEFAQTKPVAAKHVACRRKPCGI